VLVKRELEWLEEVATVFHLVIRVRAVSMFSSTIASENVLFCGDGDGDDDLGGDGLKKKKFLGLDIIEGFISV
jgi:hypothetical protein